MEKNYYELEIAFNESSYDSVYTRLYIYDITTILEENGVLKIYFPEAELQTAEKIKNDLITQSGLQPGDVQITKFDNHDWNKEWEKTIEPVYIKDKLIVYPSWKKDELADAENKILIEIDPKMSFGTGHNETTQLILGMMCDHIDDNDKTLFDFGTGTGILAIAGIKMGAEHAIAIDIDDDSIENAKGYIEDNGVSGRIKLLKADISDIPETDFDAITANITSGVIIPNLTRIYNKLKPGGKLFITGILNEEAEELINNLTQHNFMMKELASKAEWSAFYCIKK